jgi:hypothetical protein
MKIGYYFFVFLASTGLLACSDNGNYNDLESDSVSVSVSLKGLSASRATGPTDIYTKDTKNVESVCINITDVNGKVIVYRQISKSTELNSDWVSLTESGDGLKFINVPKSVSKVYVYGNPGTDVVDNVISTDIKKQQGSGVIYYGVDDDLTPIQNEPVDPNPTSGQTYTAEVSIVPIVARMQIKSISFENTGSFKFSREINGVAEEATVSWTGFSAVLKGIYFNNFYFKYNKPGILDDLYQNTTFQSHITDGMWLFDRTSTMDASDYASYVNYANGVYNDLPLQEADKCYAFNFFPGTAMPTIHLDLDQINVTGMTSTNAAVFNPDLVKNVRFANIVKFYKDIDTEMTPADFKPGTIYNMDIKVVPMLDNDLSNIQYNILIHVTIEPWVEETIIPDFDFVQ